MDLAGYLSEISMNLPRRILVPACLGLLAACTTGSSDSDSGGSSDVTVSFVSSQSDEVEDAFNLPLTVVLSGEHDEDVDVSFLWSGSATEFADYFIVSSPPITIPAGSVSSAIEVQILEDDIGELDETLKLTLVEPPNADLGVPASHTVTILDDPEDAQEFAESEPNEDHTEANVVGDVDKGVRWVITGSMVVGDFDAFELTAQSDHTVHLSLDPSSGVSEVVLNLVDESGNVIDTVDDDVGGTTITTTLDVVAGQTFFLIATVEVAGTNYELQAVGL